MNFDKDHIKTICETLFNLKEKTVCILDDLQYLKTSYKASNLLPDPDTMQPFTKGQRLKGRDQHYWFHLTFQTPAINPDHKLYFNLKTGREGGWDALNPQGIVYLNGRMTQALDTNHTFLQLPYDTSCDMFIYFYLGMNQDAEVDFYPSLFEVDVPIETLYYDLHVPYEASLCLDEDSKDYRTIMKSLIKASSILDFREPFSQSFYYSIRKASSFLMEEFYLKQCGKSDAVVHCIGHTHIDVAWLWTVRQTVEKAQRSFSTVVELMKQYPEYKFMSSQPQLYEFVKKEAPDLYNEIKKLVKEKRWEPEGAMWLEADCNLTGGESLVRQIMFGKRFFKEEFQVDNKILWLPDVFGYSAALPQILKKCGITRFVTSKISWNETNKMPYDSFLWEGIDGTEIFTYFITAQDAVKNKEPQNITTYVGYIRPSQVLGTWNRYQQKDLNNETLLTFGYGDGGGGPTKDMLEQQRRLSYGLPGIPKTEINFTADFLDRVYNNFMKHTKDSHKVPRWVGELYLELHRGTYTSIAKNKKNNRKSELLYQKAETLSVIDLLLFNDPYPQDKINASWKTILLNQFHDILPGSSIYDVYANCDLEYQKIRTLGESIVSEKLDLLAKAVKTEGGLLVYNPNGFLCSDTVMVNQTCVYVKDVPAFGYKVIKPDLSASSVIAEEKHLENAFFSLQFDSDYNISSLYDKRNHREIVKENHVINQLCVFEDIPKCYDAWEITDYYKEKRWDINSVSQIEIVTDGARRGIRISRNYLSSKIIQTIYLYDDLDRIDFDTTIDWKQEHLLLKAEFPFNIHANEAAYDIQFGNVKRPTHTNSSWDQARFEVCAHKWADLSEDNYGVSLINDCKYGYSAENSTLSLTLLKCATYPNPQADKEVHTFKYSLYPHQGGFKPAGTIKKAQSFNQPMLAAMLSENLSGSLPETNSLLWCENDNVIIETVKKAEDSDNIIVRFYEAFDRQGEITLHFGFDVKEAFLCDLLENVQSSIPVTDRTAHIYLKNFEIMTLMLCVN